MDSFAARYMTWQQKRAWEDSERARMGELQRRLPAEALMPPVLAAIVKVQVLRSFHMNGKPTQPDDVVEVPEYLARDLVAIKKAIRV